MATDNTPFFKLSKEIAEDFLQTVIIVDDEAKYGPQSKPHIGLKPPQESPLKGQKLKNMHPENQPAKMEDSSHHLDAKAVIDSFARKGIICSVFLVDKENRDKLIQTVHNLASSSDIVVLDWDLQKDDGEKALEIIEELIKRTPKGSSQLRLIAVYTGIPDIHNISDKIKKLFKKLKITNVVEFDDEFSLEAEFTKIVIFAKKDTMVLPKYNNRIVSFHELSDKLTEEFTKMTTGLVSNAILKSLSQLRKNTHKILTNFSKGLDAPYLTHRILLSTPEDAKAHLVSLIAGELQAILEEAQVGEVVNIKAIEAWVRNKEKTEFMLNADLHFSTKKLIELLQNGIDESDKIKRKGAHKQPITEMFQGEQITKFLNEKFSYFTIMKSFYKQHKPRLTMGTILKLVSTHPKYWICIQPRCDCVRIKSLRSFPFLPLVKKGNGQKFDTILLENDKYIHLKLVPKSYEIKLISFKPKSRNEDFISAQEQDDSYFFIDSDFNKYKWMGEFRYEHAQRISNEFAANLSRVGFDESEWLRLWKTKG